MYICTSRTWSVRVAGQMMHHTTGDVDKIFCEIRCHSPPTHSASFVDNRTYLPLIPEPDNTADDAGCISAVA